MFMHREENGHLMYLTGGALDKGEYANEYVVFCETCTPYTEPLVKVVSVPIPEGEIHNTELMQEATDLALAHAEQPVPEVSDEL